MPGRDFVQGSGILSSHKFVRLWIAKNSRGVSDDTLGPTVDDGPTGYFRAEILWKMQFCDSRQNKDIRITAGIQKYS